MQDWHARQRLSFSFDAFKSAWQTIHDLQVENFSFSTSDVQQGRAGDFLVADTAFHVTVSPMSGVYEKCRANLRDGLKVYLILPDRGLQGTRQNAEATEAGRIFVDSLEAFIGGNLDEMSAFSRQATIDQFRKLLDLYNRRVDTVETDKSMMMEIPAALARSPR